MRAELLSLSRVAFEGGRERTIALHLGRRIARQPFYADVAGFRAAFQNQKEQFHALYYEAAYPFAVMLFALLHAGKQVWIPANNRPATAEKLLLQGCRLVGEWPGGESVPEPEAHSKPVLKPLDLNKRQLTIFTSGSSGQPKAIAKTLLQLQREVEELERQWGAMLGPAAALATVSHQHIYGLLFRLLWPLAAGRCFHSRRYLSPEPMLKAVTTTPAYWVASPAQLKRLDERSEWNKIARLSAIFSSGAPLPAEPARQIEQRSGQRVVEVYGSSETGGIGWRRAMPGAKWTPFAGIELITGSGRCRLHSPFLSQAEPCWLDDGIGLHGDGRFTLAGRFDRIVKVEEKRISLDELEQVLQDSEQVAQAHCLLLAGARERIATIVVLTDKGRIALQKQGRTAVIRQLRAQLMAYFEAVVLPRKWLFMNAVPLTPQAKIDNPMLMQLLQLDPLKYPRLLSCRQHGDSVQLELRVRPELVYFDGHFPGQSILPGVAQLAWVEGYGKIFFTIQQPFLTMEVIKFKKIIQPGTLLAMTLEWKAAKGKLYFEVNSATESHSSGRMVYATRI